MPTKHPHDTPPAPETDAEVNPPAPLVTVTPPAKPMPAPAPAVGTWRNVQGKHGFTAVYDAPDEAAP